LQKNGELKGYQTNLFGAGEGGGGGGFVVHILNTAQGISITVII